MLSEKVVTHFTNKNLIPEAIERKDKVSKLAIRFPQTSYEKNLHEIIRNLDYTLKVSKARKILIASDQQGEGKNVFLKSSLPLLAALYNYKILILDMKSKDSDMYTYFDEVNAVGQVDYINKDQLHFYSFEKNSQFEINDYVEKNLSIYDLIFINSKTLHRAERTEIPDAKFDGAFVIRSQKSVGKKIRPVTAEIRDREIPILGLLYNEGAQ